MTNLRDSVSDQIQRGKNSTDYCLGLLQADLKAFDAHIKKTGVPGVFERTHILKSLQSSLGALIASEGHLAGLHAALEAAGQDRETELVDEVVDAARGFSDEVTSCDFDKIEAVNAGERLTQAVKALDQFEENEEDREDSEDEDDREDPPVGFKIVLKTDGAPSVFFENQTFSTFEAATAAVEAVEAAINLPTTYKVVSI